MKTQTSEIEMQFEIESNHYQMGEVGGQNSISDYPTLRNEKGESDHCVIGFRNFESAQEFAEKYNGTVNLFTKRNGHYFFHDNGEMIRPLSAYDYLQDLGDNYYIQDENDFDGLTDEDIDELKKLKYNEVAIFSNGQHYETVTENMMSYYEDVTYYVIGVLIPFEEAEEVEEEA